MADPNHRIAIVVAVIGVIGTLGAALLANWDKVFGRSHPASPSAPAAAAAPEARSLPDIAGRWRDSAAPPVTSSITQAGASFRFSRQGSLPNGLTFSSSGSGKLEGRQITSSYEARYSQGAVSTGTCAGSLSADATRMELQCSDSLLGAFTSSAVRE